MKLLFHVMQTETVKHYDGKEYLAVTLYSLQQKENDNRRASEPVIMVPKTSRNVKTYRLWRIVKMELRPV